MNTEVKFGTAEAQHYEAPMWLRKIVRAAGRISGFLGAAVFIDLSAIGVTPEQKTTAVAIAGIVTAITSLAAKFTGEVPVNPYADK